MKTFLKIGGEAIEHTTYHRYTVRARQGSSQSSRDVRAVGTRPKSAGANLRRHNETALIDVKQNTNPLKAIYVLQIVNIPIFNN